MRISFPSSGLLAVPSPQAQPDIPISYRHCLTLLTQLRLQTPVSGPPRRAFHSGLPVADRLAHLLTLPLSVCLLPAEKMLHERASLFFHRLTLVPQSSASPRAQETSAESGNESLPSPTATSTTSVLTDVVCRCDKVGRLRSLTSLPARLVPFEAGK